MASVLATRARFGPESRWLPLSTLTPTELYDPWYWEPRQGQQVIIRNGKSVSGIGTGVAHWQELRLPQSHRRMNPDLVREMGHLHDPTISV